MNMQHLQPNTTLQGGKYIIEHVLGQGGFGITYLAYHPSLKREVAIKEFFMKDYCSRDDDSRTMTAPSLNRGGFVEMYRKKFIKEARNLARLNHPYIISVIDVFEENDTVYYVMPYLSKGSLQDCVEKDGTLSEQVAMKYVKQIAQALKYMHEEEHICHYDVKPANILLDDKDNAVLIDFGISKNYDAKGQETTTTPVGVSEGYAPIEQYQQNVEEFSPTSDVYALGATLYFLLHGKRPASAIHRASGTTLLMSTQLSQGIKDIITTSMKVSKRDRAQSIDMFLEKGADDSNTIVFLLLGSFLMLAFVFVMGIEYHFKKPEDGVAVDSCSIIEDIVIKGKVNNSIPFTMHLSLDGNNVEGTEHYDNQRENAIIKIKGNVDDNGTMTLYEYDKNKNTGIYIGTLGTDTYSGTFFNNRGKDFSFSSDVMNEETFHEWSNTQFETSLVSYKKNADDIDVEIIADYPIKGNEELLGKTRRYIAESIEKFFDINTRILDLPDGQALLTHSGNLKYEELKKEKKEKDDIDCEYEETIKIQKSFENDKCVSFCARSHYYHGGVGNSFCIGATFRKDDGKRIVVLKDYDNYNLWSLIQQTVKTEVGDDNYEWLWDDFKEMPMPKELPHLTKSGVQIDYQHYEIGPGSLGQISIVIPYEKIKKYMTEEAKQLVY